MTMRGLERRFNTCINIQDLDLDEDEDEHVLDNNNEKYDIENHENVTNNFEKHENDINSKCNTTTDEIPAKINRRHLPPPSGPYSVGCVDIMDNNTEQGSFFRLFYPVAKTDIFQRNTQWPLWLPRKEYGFGYASFLKKNKYFGKFFNWLGGNVYIPALWQAPIFDSNERFPVVIMSHGIGGNRTTYSTLCCELAAQGIIVAVPEHRDGSASMTYLLKDNMQQNTVELIKDCERSGKHKRHSMHRSQSFKDDWKPFEHCETMDMKWDDFKYRNDQIRLRANECSRLLDLLTNIDKGLSIRNFLGFHFSLKQFKDRLDMSRVAFTGHSFGGSTCVPTLAQDKRFKIGVMLDVWMHPLDEELCSKVTQPLLLLNYEKFQWKKNVDKMEWLQKDGVDRQSITIKGACHQACSDFQFLCNKTFGKIMEVRSDVSPKTAMFINKNAIIEFLCEHFGIEDMQHNEGILLGRHDHVMKGAKYLPTRIECAM